MWTPTWCGWPRRTRSLPPSCVLRPAAHSRQAHPWTRCPPAAAGRSTAWMRGLLGPTAAQKRVRTARPRRRQPSVRAGRRLVTGEQSKSLRAAAAGRRRQPLRASLLPSGLRAHGRAASLAAARWAWVTTPTRARQQTRGRTLAAEAPGQGPQRMRTPRPAPQGGRCPEGLSGPTWWRSCWRTTTATLRPPLGGCQGCTASGRAGSQSRSRRWKPACRRQAGERAGQRCRGACGRSWLRLPRGRRCSRHERQGACERVAVASIIKIHLCVWCCTCAC